ncbi:SulP family inorganic anion transporter [Methylococcus sp. EFPC2]|uniref:SulP family inorganic anion transporter n=1 Tax=Methylococcus sp. EFPC2 TaxID=2812648 RepID=UPI0019676AFA|nr:SulP family inorganic anion transporter [Methylococcus sp. EFPC2]QSA95843.1 SulP family inorganic anion transporter [Methylococcus sp. EFPC2]
MDHPVNLNSLPATGLTGLKAHWRKDIAAGFLVFLIALPLCLGVAVASGFPPMAGILTAAVGGLLVSRINGSHVTITGPAAGLIVVILAAVQSLGQGDAMAGYRYTLAAIVISGVLQIALGYYKAGRLSAFFPASVVHGMLAAIGIIIMAKQIPVMAGVKTVSGGLLSSIADIPRGLSFFIPEVAFVALVGLGVLVAWPKVQQPWLRKIPAPLLVVASGMFLGQVFGLDHLRPGESFMVPKDLIVGPDFLVTIPDSIAASFYFPDFSKIFTLAFWESVLAITLVGSLESLLSTAAVDKLDPYQRYSDLNRDLTAVGVGNTLAGLIGGLPMIAEIVRSSANVDAGARTGWANFFHGAFLLIFVIALPHVIDTIPLASLAALLVYTGFRLASPQAFERTMDLGKEQLVLFVLTIVGVLATNLLAGVLIGIAAKLVIHVARGVPLRNLLTISYHLERRDANTCVIRVSGSAIFSNFLALKSQLAEFPAAKTVVFDLSDAYLIDHTVMEFIEHYRQDRIARGGHCEIHGLGEHEAYADHVLAARINKQQA